MFHISYSGIVLHTYYVDMPCRCDILVVPTTLPLSLSFRGLNVSACFDWSPYVPCKGQLQITSASWDVVGWYIEVNIGLKEYTEGCFVSCLSNHSHTHSIFHDQVCTQINILGFQRHWHYCFTKKISAWFVFLHIPIRYSQSNVSSYLVFQILTLGLWREVYISVLSQPLSPFPQSKYLPITNSYSIQVISLR